MLLEGSIVLKCWENKYLSYSKGKDMAFGKTKRFDFIKLRKYFNIGCLIDLNTEENDVEFVEINDSLAWLGMSKDR
jgi:hypothetical protein